MTEPADQPETYTLAAYRQAQQAHRSPGDRLTVPGPRRSTDTMTDTTTRVSADDLEWAAGWLLAYEGESGDPVAAQAPDDDDEQQATARRVAAWIDAEVARRNRAADERAVAREVARRSGRSSRDPIVRAAVRNAARSRIT